MNTFAILPGDKRQFYITKYLKSLGFPAYEKTNFNFNNNEIVITSTPFSRDGVSINCDFHSNFPIDTFIDLLPDSQLIFGGNIPEKCILYGKKKNITFIDFLKNENVVYDNSILTAEGLLAKIILSTDFSLKDSKVLILGFGRCGTNIARYLSLLNSSVTIYDHTKIHMEKAKKDGYNTLEFTDFCNELCSFNIIINTVPEEIFSDFHMSLIDQSCILFEIASKPYGFNSELVKKYNLSLATCPGLPGATAPKSAGELIAKSIISYLERTEMNDS